MGSPRTDFDLVLEAPDPIEAEMARGLLASAGIPSLLHGQDRDFAELGCAVHRCLARPDLYVPRGLRQRARELLAEAWDPTALSEEVPEESAADEKKPVAQRPDGFFRMAVIALIHPPVALIALCLRLFRRRR
jgi:hypothetical protein